MTGPGQALTRDAWHEWLRAAPDHRSTQSGTSQVGRLAAGVHPAAYEDYVRNRGPQRHYL